MPTTPRRAKNWGPLVAEPQLQPPGAGVPKLEELFLRYVFTPVMQKWLSWDESHKAFLAETDEIISVYQHMKPEDHDKRVLIPRLTGLEDSSRYWSANMVLEHVMLVTKGIVNIIETLGDEKIMSGKVSTAAVKPKGGHDEDMMPAFWEAMHQAADRVGEDFQKRASQTTHDHPWFGPLNTHGWHTVLAIHQGVHRRQIEKIAARL